MQFWSIEQNKSADKNKLSYLALYNNLRKLLRSGFFAVQNSYKWNNTTIFADLSQYPPYMIQQMEIGGQPDQELKKE